MANFGNFQNSLLSNKNEFSPALVNINLDISLFRCNPAAEFLRVGSALTSWRKKEAEDGHLHKTACRLGFLFSEILPDTPELLKAFGTRASEILDSPNINPQGTAEDGPFRDFIGADGTCIWAAATSTAASIGVYLLACILARAWDAKTATSLWVELIRDRKAQVQSLLDSGKIVNPHTVIAIQQDVTRDDLAKWDASVRAWLRRADCFMDHHRNQFALIMNNVGTPFIDTGTTYEKVTTAWKRAMETMERLLNNKPQQADDRIILIAISSWHMYPNLVVFQEQATSIIFKDTLFKNSAVLSLGLEYVLSQRGKFNRWSLALSHLRYYGDPVKVQSEGTLQRVNVGQLWLAALGATLRQWQVQLSNLRDSVIWFERMGILIQNTSQRNSAEISWLRKMFEAVSTFSTASIPEQQTIMSLVQFGHRRGIRFLGGAGGIWPPYFGVCDLQMFGGNGKHKAIGVGFKYLRMLAGRINLQPHQAILCYTDRASEGFYTEWATLSPQDSSTTSVSYSTHGSISGKRNVRWISFREKTGLEYVRNERIDRRARDISLAGEVCKVMMKKDDGPFYPRSNSHRSSPAASKLPQEFVWNNPPPLFSKSGNPTEFVRIRDFMDILGLEFVIYGPRGGCSGQGLGTLPDLYLQACLLALDHDPDPDAVARKLLANMVKVWLQQDGDLRSGECIISLRSLELASMLYANMPTATISLRIVEQELHQARWLPDSLKSLKTEQFGGIRHVLATPIEEHCKGMTRERSLGCVAMFESGIINIDPEYMKDVIAISCEDSIFVAGILLSDPRLASLGNLGMDVRHLVGNVGQPGMVLMIAPVEPRIRPQTYDARAIQHKSYDGQTRDSFQGTSLHLSFTEWKMPLGSVIDCGQTGEIDHEVVQVESVIAVRDGGRWVADIDVLQIEREGLTSVDFTCICDRSELPGIEVVALDSWQELLDPPASPAIMRANGNWAARLAAASILTQQGHNHCIAIIGDDAVCWKCLIQAYTDPEPHVPSFIIH
ncbi:hypothetical protein LZ32DRAFT_678456 [Colletotrichum eremochloae]|nr:hypothetical protein LZ32DRAFT_678456 [Colletotrichum eremochloae]